MHVCVFVCVHVTFTPFIDPYLHCRKTNNECVSFLHYISHLTVCPLRGVQRLRGYATINNLLLQQQHRCN